MTPVHIVAKGATGCGKTAVLHEIYIALKAIGVPVEYARPAEAESERRLGTPDDMDRLLKEGLSVILHEENADG
jgi:hypothetical protein